MRIARLNAYDLPEITKLYQADFSDGWTADMLKSAFESGRFFALGAIENGALIGVITVTSGLDDADIEGVVTASAHRGKGVAKTLLTAVIDLLKADKKERILLEVREGNVPAINLYKSAGFKEISIRKKYYADGENALVMEKVIL